MSCSDAPLAVFRFDASPVIGAGHAVRSLTLADLLVRRGWTCVGAGSPATPDAIPGGLLPVMRWLVLDGDGEDEGELLAARLGGPCDLVVIDHYGRGLAFERACRGFARRIAVIDDAPGRPHDADLLIDQTPSRRAGEYSSWVPTGCRVLAGSDYALLRPAFLRRRERSLARIRPARPDRPRLLVSLGATDPAGVIPAVLRGLHCLGRDVDIDVVLGSVAPHRNAIADQIERMSGRAVLHIDPPDPAALVEAADLAIGAGGVSCLERCCLGVPSLLIVVAENQRDNVAALASLGAGVPIGAAADITAETVAQAVRMELASDLAAKSHAAAQVCDGQGGMRAVEAIARVAGVNS